MNKALDFIVNEWFAFFTDVKWSDDRRKFVYNIKIIFYPWAIDYFISQNKSILMFMQQIIEIYVSFCCQMWMF